MGYAAHAGLAAADIHTAAAERQQASLQEPDLGHIEVAHIGRVGSCGSVWQDLGVAGTAVRIQGADIHKPFWTR